MPYFASQNLTSVSALATDILDFHEISLWDYTNKRHILIDLAWYGYPYYLSANQTYGMDVYVKNLRYPEVFEPLPFWVKKWSVPTGEWMFSDVWNNYTPDATVYKTMYDAYSFLGVTIPDWVATMDRNVFVAVGSGSEQLTNVDAEIMFQQLLSPILTLYIEKQLIDPTPAPPPWRAGDWIMPRVYAQHPTTGAPMQDVAVALKVVIPPYATEYGDFPWGGLTDANGIYREALQIPWEASTRTLPCNNIGWRAIDALGGRSNTVLGDVSYPTMITVSVTSEVYANTTFDIAGQVKAESTPSVWVPLSTASVGGQVIATLTHRYTGAVITTPPVGTDASGNYVITTSVDRNGTWDITVEYRYS